MASEAPVYRSKGEVPSAPSVMVAPISAPVPDASGVGKAIGGFGDAAVKTFTKQASEAQQATKALRAKVDTGAAVDQLAAEHANDPDYAAAPEKFDQAASEVASKNVGTVDDPVQRAQAAQDTDEQIATAQRQVATAALVNEHADNQKMLAGYHDLNVKAVMNAGSITEVASAINRNDRAVDAASRAGWISPDEAQARRLNFARDVDAASADKSIEADPVTAQIALSDPQRFGMLTNAERADLIGKAQDKVAVDAALPAVAPSAEGFSLLQDGKMTAEWLNTNRPLLPVATARQIDAAFAAPEPQISDPQALWRVLEAGNRAPDSADGLAADARGQSAISTPQMQAAMSGARNAQALHAKAPWAAAVRGELIGRLKPDGDQDPVEAVQQLGGVAQFDKYLSDTPDVSEAAARSEAGRIAQEFRGRAAANERFKLEPPRFAGASSSALTPEKLLQAGERLRDAHAGGLLSDDDLVAQVDTMRRWQSVFARGGSGSK